MFVLRCSGAGRWARCAMSAHLERHPDALPDTDEDAAAEGTCAAWVAECVINGDATTAEDIIGRVHKNGVEVDPDMARHLEPYIDMARKRISARAEVYGEIPLGPGAMIAGTSDMHSWSSVVDFHIDDLKYGYGIVEPTTLQLTAYMAIAYAQGVRAPIWHLGIYQPRAVHSAGTYRTRSLTLEQVQHEVQALITTAHAIVEGRTQGAQPGDQCLHCRGGHKCEALTHSVYSMWQPVTSRAINEPTDQQIADELDMLERMSDLVKARKVAVETEAKERVNRGRMVPGWAMMPTKGKRKFKVDGDVIHGLTMIDPFDKVLCTPAELERRGAPKALVDALSYTPTVGYKLARYDSRVIDALFKGR